MSDAPFGFGPLRRSVMDPVTGRPVITSAPTGAVTQRSTLLPIGRDNGGRLTPAVPGLLMNALDAMKYPGQVWRGEKSVYDPASGHVSDEAVGKAGEIAGLAMTGSLPFSAPKGALRSFGGAAAKDASDPLAALEAALGKADIQPVTTPRSFVDPAAKSWDLFHGTAAPVDFERFGTKLPDAMRSNTTGSTTQGEAVFFTPAAREAGHYALGRANRQGEGTEAGPRTFRVTMDPGKTKLFDLPDMIANDPSFREDVWRTLIDQRRQRGGDISPAVERDLRAGFDRETQSTLDSLARTRAFNDEYGHLGVRETPQVSYHYGATDAVIRRAKEQGLDSAVIRGLSESNGGDQVVALTPGRVRSFYDPNHLLYGFAGLAAGGALTAPKEAQAAPARQPFGFGPFQ